MSDLDVSVVISRGSLGPLQVNSAANGYKVIRDGFGPGDVQWKRKTAESIFIHGRTLVNAVMEQSNAVLEVRVTGNSRQNLMDRIKTLIYALSQETYTITTYIDGAQTGAWTCEPADISVGNSGAWEDLHIRSNTQVVRADIPRLPNQSQGPL
jgi:hypothetical protein